MIEKEYEKQGSYSFYFRWQLYEPILLLLAVIPLVVRLVKADITDISILYITRDNIDFFHKLRGPLF